MSDEQRLAQVRQRVSQHQAHVQQCQGRKASLEEQRASYVEELAKAGLTPEQLPAKIEELNDAISAAVGELEQVLDSVGA